MHSRCYNTRSQKYHNYGGRGISVCKEWQDSFRVFYLHVGDPPTKKHSIDRKDVNGNYEPGNVKWSTQKQQTRNMRKSRYVELFGVIQCVSAWEIDLDLPKDSLGKKVRNGVHPGVALHKILCAL